MLDLVARLASTTLGREAVLAGSTGVYGASDGLPALTEDVDLVVDAEWLAAHETAVLADLAALGFVHQPGTCTFVGPGGALDLIGYSRVDVVDRIGGGPTVPVMVFGDLSVILGGPGAVRALPRGGRGLSPAALVAAKLLTVRLEKGGKDKVQALLIAAEQVGGGPCDPESASGRAGSGAAPGFREDLADLLARFPEDRVVDALADAQAAFLTLSADPLRRDAAAAGYGPYLAAAERGVAIVTEAGGLARLTRARSGGRSS